MTTMDFLLDVDGSRAPYTVVSLRGDIDVLSGPRLRECLVELVSEGHRRVVLDLSRVVFIDSAGLGIIVAGLKRLRALEGDLALAGATANVLNVFEITGLASVFRMAATVDEASLS
jgi:anti-sigma B factor antagonist